MRMKRLALLTMFWALFSVSAVSCAEEKNNDLAKIYTESNYNASQKDISSSRQNAITKAVEKASPAIVGINVTEMREVQYRSPFDSFFGDDPFFNQFFGNRGGQTKKYKVQGLGSGFIISPDGYILTNHHVAGNASEIIVTMTNGEKYKAEIIGSDMVTDVAVLKIDAKNLPYLKFTNSDDVIIGEWVIAFGNPFGLFNMNAKPTVTVGVVSNTNISFVQDDKPNYRVYRGMIQTDAAISSGNSGGPLVNSLGEVIGMNTVIFSTAQGRSGAGSIGIGFAIPINRVKSMVDMIKKHKTLDRNYYSGIDVREIDEQYASYLKTDKKEGVFVYSVDRNSPAESAGIEPGDIINKINGENIQRTDDFYIMSGDAVVGDELNFEIQRDGKSMTKSLKLISKPRR